LTTSTTTTTDATLGPGSAVFLKIAPGTACASHSAITAVAAVATATAQAADDRAIDDLDIAVEQQDTDRCAAGLPAATTIATTTTRAAAAASSAPRRANI